MVIPGYNQGCPQDIKSQDRDETETFIPQDRDFFVSPICSPVHPVKIQYTILIADAEVFITGLSVAKTNKTC